LSVDLEILFGNIYEVVELSQKFINLLEANTLGKPFQEQLVGMSQLVFYYIKIAYFYVVFFFYLHVCIDWLVVV